MKKLYSLLIVCIVAVATVYAQQQPMPLIPIDKDVRIGKLDNGLSYYIRKNNLPANQANFYIVQKVGSMIDTRRLHIRPLSYDELRTYSLSPADLAAELGLTISRSLIDEETKQAIETDLLPKLTDPENDPLFYTMWILIEKECHARLPVGGIGNHSAIGSHTCFPVGGMNNHSAISPHASTGEL